MAKRVHADGLTARELVLLADITYRQLDYWCRRGWLHPDAGDGMGQVRAFPPAEVDICQRMAALVKAGLTVQQAAERARTQHDTPPELEHGMARVRTYAQAFRERFRL